ncbi:MAG: [FeFe] hydrogenase H-cluster radical SAM maturase HydE [Christensenellales bacterium]|jgi:biotin synthase
MKSTPFDLIERLEREHALPLGDYEALISGQTAELSEFAAKKADAVRRSIYGADVYVRGLIEVGNICRNDCLYCGIRRSNAHCERYMLSDEEILSCCREGYGLGFRTFVLQGGEGTMKAVRVCSLVARIRERYPDCAITLSLGEYEREEYRRMYGAGANRYLLRHETADQEHYEKLHPKELSFANRMRCLHDLKEIGFQTGCGFMVGSPFQTVKTLAKDLKFIEEFQPDMCGIGPFIPQKDTPFGEYPAGSAEQTLFLLSLIRLIRPNILLPATTALGTLDSFGREKGVLSGANVIMPNLSPMQVRAKYALYDNKIATGDESAQSLENLKRRMESIGCRIVTARGDVKKET